MFIVSVEDYAADDAEEAGDAASSSTFSGGSFQQEIGNYRIDGWSDLPKDILGLIADRLFFSPDFTRFSSVCVAWRSMALEKRHIFTCQPPLLMVSYKEDTGTCNFFCLSDMEFYKHHLPELRNTWCCGSSNGWLIVLDDDLRLSLLNPFSRARIQLPPHPLLDVVGVPNVTREGSQLWKHEFIHKVILSDNPTTRNNCLVMAFMSDAIKFSFCKLGDKTWTLLETAPCHDIVYFGGQIYASFIDDADTQDFDADFNSNAVQRVQMNVPLGSLEMEQVRYFVNCSGELLHVIRYWKIILVDDEQQEPEQQLHDDINGEGDDSDDEIDNCEDNDSGGSDDQNNTNDGVNEEIFDSSPYYRTAAFQVFKLERGSQESDSQWIELKNLGDQALFLGGGHSMSVTVSNSPNCKANCIYFMDDNYDCLETLPRCTDMGIFNMTDGSIEPFPIAPTWSSLPFWLTQTT